ncbi:glycoside hydrolase family 53 protein [Glycomyces terrestris]|uniref:Arabinogalactan endo-beta-1,4-galactanase n=1 Tax=Glycomyces terrestris TaxID=2493553 RepID=A0A426UWP9_9ACTN|nr:arabinogalactan endo-1,4-beta-galactosidase [Glycomyces terrestris]RRR98648.1 arabinogalactan endo-1,4-beta-galactosidase [Glycomyces terrestris]
MKRRTALTAAVAAPALAVLGGGTAASAQTAFARGADISSLAKSEALGGVYMWPDGWREDAVWILQKSGVNWMRLKVWVNPADGYNNKTHVVNMAKRARAAGLNVLVDFHYSDSWADPGQQTKPAAWRGYSFAQLRTAVYDHTADVLGALAAAGATPQMVQVGNELNGGMLWPEGRYDQLDQLAQFLISGANAVYAKAPGAKVMLHLAEGGNNSVFRWFFDAMKARGVWWDAIGASYYPYWHGSLAGLQSNLNDMASRYGKPVYVVETAYPFTAADSDGHANVVSAATPVSGYPANTTGQSNMLKAIANVVKNVPNGRGAGVFWWEPTWTAVRGNGWDPADPSSGNAWENQALFDFAWKATPALKTLGTL